MYRARASGFESAAPE
uniref:Opr5 n=1 Tax=Arundo donax TaxID=35708 RepID=A0A0A8YI28_ARUDO